MIQPEIAPLRGYPFTITWWLGLLCAVWFALAPKAMASSISATLGPPGFGGGGTNPVGIPPSAFDLDLAYENDRGHIYSLAVVPGFFVGKRHYKDSFFGGYGAGLIFHTGGLAPGIYTSLGYRATITGGLDFLMEFKQGLGIDRGLVRPYALRIGAMYAL